MGVTDFLSLLRNIIEIFPFTVLDLIFFVSLVIYVAGERQRETLKSLVVALFSIGLWVASLFLYSWLSTPLQSSFHVSKGMADGLSLTILLIFLGVIFAICYRLLMLNLSDDLVSVKVPGLSMGFGSCTYLMLIMILSVILLSFPVVPVVKNSIERSVVLNGLTQVSNKIESSISKVSAKKSTTLLNFQTVAMSGVDKKRVVFSQSAGIDEQRQKKLISLLNKKRKEKTMPALELHEAASSAAQRVAQNMANDMLLSRESNQGQTLFDILEEEGVGYADAYLLVSHAQTMELALNGFEQIKEYNTYLFSPEYQYIGTGVISLNQYGYLIAVVLLR